MRDCLNNKTMKLSVSLKNLFAFFITTVWILFPAKLLAQIAWTVDPQADIAEAAATATKKTWLEQKGESFHPLFGSIAAVGVLMLVFGFSNKRYGMVSNGVVAIGIYCTFYVWMWLGFALIITGLVGRVLFAEREEDDDDPKAKKGKRRKKKSSDDQGSGDDVLGELHSDSDGDSKQKNLKEEAFNRGLR